jgi:hypothetical protein
MASFGHGVDACSDDLIGGGQGRGQQRLTGWQTGQQRPGPTGVELGEHVVEQQYRGCPEPIGGQLMGGQLQGQRQRPLFPLGRMGTGRHPGQRQLQLVAVRTDRRYTSLDIRVTGLGERLEQRS